MISFLGKWHISKHLKTDYTPAPPFRWYLKQILMQNLDTGEVVSINFDSIKLTLFRGLGANGFDDLEDEEFKQKEPHQSLQNIIERKMELHMREIYNFVYQWKG